VVPVALKTQTQRISFIGNVARNVSHGVWIAGSESNKPTDVLIQGNSFAGLGGGDCGLDIEQATRVTIQGNTFDGFAEAMIMNDVRRGYPYNVSTYIFIDNSTIQDGSHSRRSGHAGGWLHGHK